MDNKVRIIAGELKNRIIKFPKKTETRPALVLVRRVVCDTLMPYIDGADVLDLFAGTGAFVFELISRGANSAVAIDLDKRMAESIAQNAGEFGIDDRVRAVNQDYLKAIDALSEGGRQFDIIIVAPPFYGDYVNTALRAIQKNSMLKPDGIVMAHYHKKDDVNREQPALELWKTKTHGNSVMDFFIENKGPR